MEGQCQDVNLSAFFWALGEVFQGPLLVLRLGVWQGLPLPLALEAPPWRVAVLSKGRREVVGDRVVVFFLVYPLQVGVRFEGAWLTRHRRNGVLRILRIGHVQPSEEEWGLSPRRPADELGHASINERPKGFGIWEVVTELGSFRSQSVYTIG